MESIQFDRVSKRYRLGESRNARESLVAAAQRLTGRRRTAPAEIWPLREVSFTAAHGEAVGIIGRNGAGKSTVLKIISGITSPTSGVSRTRGRVAGLLEVGTGFHGELTGRENIYLNGAILGMSRRDIAGAFDAIVDFSGVELFLDTPVKHYSSGMHLRLAFAVAAHLEPDVLVIDEILAVGDAEFRRKCMGRMEQAGKEGRTVVLVSHDLDVVTQLCDRSLWIDAGQVRLDGPSPAVVEGYLLSAPAGQQAQADVLIASEVVSIHGVRVESPGREPGTLLHRDEVVRVTVDFDVAETRQGLDFTMYLTSRRGVRVLDEAWSDEHSTSLGPGSYRAVLDVPPYLNAGDFVVGSWFGTPYEDVLDAPALVTFTLHGSDRGRPERVLVSPFPLQVGHRDDAG